MLLGTAFSGPLCRRKPAADDLQSPLSGPLRALELAFEQADARKADIYRRGLPPARPTLLEHGPLRFLVSAAPAHDDLQPYAHLLLKHNVTHVVSVCQPPYDPDALRRRGFHLHHLPFPDGHPPPPHVVADWLALLDNVFDLRNHVARAAARRPASPSGSDLGSDSSDSSLDRFTETIAIHCPAGLGRAPVLAALALIEFGMDPYEAVGWIRALRRGAINARQLAFLQHYTPRPLHIPNHTRPRSRSRSGALVGALWPTLKGARPFRPRSPQSGKHLNAHPFPLQPSRFSNVLAQSRS